MFTISYTTAAGPCDRPIEFTFNELHRQIEEVGSLGIQSEIELLKIDAGMFKKHSITAIRSSINRLAMAANQSALFDLALKTWKRGKDMVVVFHGWHADLPEMEALTYALNHLMQVVNSRPKRNRILFGLELEALKEISKFRNYI